MSPKKPAHPAPKPTTPERKPSPGMLKIPTSTHPHPSGKRLEVPIVVDPKNMTIDGLAKGLDEHAAVMANPLVIDAIARGREDRCTHGELLTEQCTECSVMASSEGFRDLPPGVVGTPGLPPEKPIVFLTDEEVKAKVLEAGEVSFVPPVSDVRYFDADGRELDVNGRRLDMPSVPEVKP